MKPLICTTLALLGSSVLLPAATMFTEDFSDFSPNPNMATGTAYGTTTVSYAAGNFDVGADADSYRVYLGTVGTDYSTVDFVFECTVTTPTASAWGSVFFGMGDFDAGAGTLYGEAVTNQNLLMVMRTDIGGGDLYDRDNATTAVGAVRDTDMGTVIGGTHLMRMTWNAATKMAFFEFDTGNNDSIDGSFSLNGADNGFNASNSQLILGGGRDIKFDNISIVPEPSAALLGGLGMLALLRRRR